MMAIQQVYTCKTIVTITACAQRLERGDSDHLLQRGGPVRDPTEYQVGITNTSSSSITHELYITPL